MVLFIPVPEAEHVLIHPVNVLEISYSRAFPVLGTTQRQALSVLRGLTYLGLGGRVETDSKHVNKSFRIARGARKKMKHSILINTHAQK